MKATYAAAMARVFADEGGYTDHPKDPGGATNYGITIIDANKYAAEFGWIVGRKVTPADMRAMPKAFAEAVYATKYAAPIRYNDLPPGYDYTGLDATINSGFGRFVPWSAKAIGKPVKSVQEVVIATNAASDKVALIQRFWKVRLAFLQSLRTWSTFGKGWGRRCANGEAAAVKMWLTFGAALQPTEVKAKMATEAKKASAASKKNGAAAATSASAGAATSTAGGSDVPAIDITHLGLGGKIALGVLIAALVLLAAYFIRKAITHKQRAAAYAAA